MVRSGWPPRTQSTLSLRWAAVSGRGRPARSLYFGSSPLSPWHEAHRSAKMGLPSAAVPLPGGNPLPSGGMVRSQSLTSSAVGARPTPYVGIWAATGEAPAAARSIPSAVTSRSLYVDIVDAAIGRHLPALDGIVVVDRVQAADLGQFGERRLEIAGFIDAPRLENDRAPIPAPVESEASVGEAEDRFLELGVLPGLSGILRDLDPADQPATRPRQAPDLVESWPRQPLATRGESDHRLRLHDEHELSGLAVRHEAGVVRAFHACHVGFVHHLDATQPFDIDVAFPARNDEPQRVAISRAGRLAVLAVGDQDVVHRLRHGDAALVSRGIPALGDDPGGALVGPGFAQQEGEGHTGPLAAACTAVRELDTRRRLGRTPLRSRVARTLKEQDARGRRQALDLVHRE